MADSSIQWTDKVWNPSIGCSRVSAGCGDGAVKGGGCYAERMAHRLATMPHTKELYAGLTRMTKAGPRWSGEVKLVPERLADPLGWKKPCRVFVNSMSDLFHEALTNEQIAAVFGVMAAAHQHQFQVLTKRAARMQDWFAWMTSHKLVSQEALIHPNGVLRLRAAQALPEIDGPWRRFSRWLEATKEAWPLLNVWLGVSVEDQATADERIPSLLETPAAVRFISYEPALGPLDLFGTPADPGVGFAKRTVRSVDSPAGPGECDVELTPLDWVIVGGESGPGARPFDLAWGLSIVEQCKAAGVACFVKQLGSDPVEGFRSDFPVHSALWWAAMRHLHPRDRKGGDISEWPEELRVREFPR